jgi:chromosome partitioning protein
MMGCIVLVTKLKGGSGATTACRELAAAAMHAGQRVALIDLDGQAGLTRWWNRRTAGGDDGSEKTLAPDLLQLTAAQIPTAAKSLRDRYDLTIIDSPPSVHETIQAVASAADLAIVPSRPTVDDLDAVGPIVRLLHNVVDQCFLLTQVPAVRSSRDGAEALEVLASRAPVLGRTTFRADYSRPPGHGGTGFEQGTTARQEIAELFTRVMERLAMLRPRDDGIILGNHDLITASPYDVMPSLLDDVITSGKG